MQDVEDFGAAHLRQVQIDVLVHGNSTQLEARALRDQVIKSLSPQPLAPGSLDFNRGLLLPPSSLHVYQTRHPSAENVNSAIVVYLQVCETDNHVLATKVSLLAQMTRQLFFATLRTKEQLGYIVSSSVYEAGGVRTSLCRSVPTLTVIFAGQGHHAADTERADVRLPRCARRGVSRRDARATPRCNER